MAYFLKGHSYKTICEFMALNHSFGLTYFNFFKLPLKKLRFFKLLILLNKMGSLDLEDLATSRLQISKRHAVVPLGQWVRS
jgi:hypothetical protein